MFNVEYRLKLGQDEFVIRGEYKNEKEFFNKMAFFSSLPKTAPGGATDLKLVVRETKKGTYYSLISEQEKLEFQLGQHKEGDTLYAKGWVPLYQADNEEGAQQSAAPIAAPIQTPKAAAPIAAPVTQQFVAPAAVQAPAPVQAAPAPVQMPAPVAPQPVAAPVQAAPAPAAPPANPATAQIANNVLARFGINK